MSFVIFYHLQESVPHCSVGGLLVEPPWARHRYQRASTWSETGYDVSAVDQKSKKRQKKKRSEFCSTCIWTKHGPLGQRSFFAIRTTNILYKLFCTGLGIWISINFHLACYYMSSQKSLDSWLWCYLGLNIEYFWQKDRQFRKAADSFYKTHLRKHP